MTQTKKWPPLDYSIDYCRIADAINHYNDRSYNYVEMPWTASVEAMLATAPPGTDITKCQEGFLVGSAEQAFMDHLEEIKFIGKLMSCTPCFRNEPEPDEFHKKYFMKLELINFDQTKLEETIKDALDFFGSKFKVVSTKLGYDIVDKTFGVEVGSYGLRSWRGHSWIYGTGLAEPRMSQVLFKIDNKKEKDKQNMMEAIEAAKLKQIKNL